MVMKEKRDKHAEVIEKFRTQRTEREIAEQQSKLEEAHKSTVEEPDEQEIKQTFKAVIATKRSNRDEQQQFKNKKPKKQQQKNTKDKDNYIPYQSADKHTEDGLAINSFEQAARNAEFSVIDKDRSTELRHKPGMKRWDRIKKKMVPVQDFRIGKIRTESGAWISSSFKTGRYNDWKEKSKIEEQLQREGGSDDENAFKPLAHAQRYPVGRHARYRAKLEASKRTGGADPELRHPDQIVKARLRLEMIKRRNAENAARKQENRKKSMRKHKQSSSKMMPTKSGKVGKRNKKK